MRLILSEPMIALRQTHNWAAQGAAVWQLLWPCARIAPTLETNLSESGGADIGRPFVCFTGWLAWSGSMPPPFHKRSVTRFDQIALSNEQFDLLQEKEV